MPTFTNKSQNVFQDGDLIVLPGEAFSTEDEGRVEQMRGQYAWQFSEGKGNDAPTEGEVMETAGSKDVRELRDTGHVEIDAQGKQSKLVGK